MTMYFLKWKSNLAMGFVGRVSEEGYKASVHEFGKDKEAQIIKPLPSGHFL